MIQRALITPTLLSWARDRMRLSVPDAASKSGFEPEVLQAWESGRRRPTVGQARQIAQAYKVPFAALFLSEPPDAPIELPHDYRRVAGTAIGTIGFDILAVVQEARSRRDIALELYELSNSSPRVLRRTLTVQNNPEDSSSELRHALAVSLETQRQWRNSRIAFNAWRAAVENLGVLVFQESAIGLEVLRGFSLDTRPLPVIMVNRSDGYASRSFTLLHELTHILLHNAGMCDLTSSTARPPEEQRVEVFCNAVAAATLMPTRELLRHPLLNVARRLNQWSDREIQDLASHFSVSREALLRRLLTLERTSQRFYEQKRNEYIQEARTRPTRSGFVMPPVDAISRLGRPYVRLVLSAYNNRSVTSSDASEFLGVKAKHFSQIAETVEAS